jgi:enoyl-CoA hydratase
VETVEVEDAAGAPGVRVVRINRPDKRNALDLATKRALADRLRDAGADPAVRAVVLTGAGGNFVAGTDIAEMATLSPTDHLLEQTGAVFGVVDDLEVPVIAAVEGYALGGGCELALCCDIVVAAASARFGQPEIKVGLVPGAGGLSRLVQRVGRSRALLVTLTGDMIDARSALEMGIASVIVDDGAAETTAVEIAARIAAHPVLNVRAIRTVARHAENAPLATAIQLERTTFQLLFDTDDHAEGLRAFTERRAPRYEGR